MKKNTFVVGENFINIGAISVLLLVFWLCIFWNIDLPGFYMDAVNPDYLAAQTLHPELKNPNYKLPSVTTILLGGFYHGVQNYYLDIVIFKLFGISVETIRIAQALFGAAIILLLYFASLAVTGRWLVSFLAATLLASDIAFISSFRTQFYIILGGEAWLFASLLALWRGGALGHVISGLCFGLAVYGYFVLGFFGPALAIFLFTRPDRRPGLWAAGVILGMAPYLTGYASLVAAVGGISQAIDTVRQGVTGLAPMSSSLSPWESARHVVELARLAATNTGNELMIFGEEITGRWGGIKTWLFSAAFVLAAVRLWHRPALLLAVLLPVSYLAVATIFGSRLWVHHFSVLVPVGYLLVAVAAGDLVRGRWTATIAIAGTALLLATNLQQSAAFHDKLTETGGTGKASDALTRLAEDALGRTGTFYVFPEWGFFMPFNLLTENRVPYAIATDRIDRSACRCERVAIAFWSAADTAKYTSVLTDKGLRDVGTQTYAQRDGRPAFHLVEGRFEP